MKFITTKELRRKYDTIIIIPMGCMQRLLSVMEKKYYHSGVYGWNYSVYEYDGYAFVSGYRPPVKNCLKITREIAEEYEQQFLYEKDIKDEYEKMKFIMDIFIESEVL